VINLPILKLKYKSFTDWDTTSTSYIDGGIVPVLVNVDSLGERYAIKATSVIGTGVIAGMPNIVCGKAYFEYLIIVLSNKDYFLNVKFEFTR